MTKDKKQTKKKTIHKCVKRSLIVVFSTLVIALVIYLYKHNNLHLPVLKNNTAQTIQPADNHAELLAEMSSKLTKLEEEISSIKHNITQAKTSNNDVPNIVLALQNLKFKIHLGLPFTNELDVLSKNTGKQHAILAQHASTGIYNLKYLITQYREIAFIQHKTKTNSTKEKISNFFHSLISIKNKHNKHDNKGPIDNYISTGNIESAVTYMYEQLPQDVLDNSEVKNWLSKAKIYIAINQEIATIEHNL